MGIKEKTISSVKWNTLSVIICTILQVARLSILTYLLDKSDFGLIAIAMMVIAFTDIFSELGITVALIHKQEISDKQYSSVYWLNIVVSILLTILVCVISPLVAQFYNNPELISITSLLSLQILFNGFGKMFQTIKTKNLDFNFISKVRILVSFLGITVTTFLAYIGLGVYSLVFGQLVQILINQLIYVTKGIQSQKILFYFSFREISDVMKIGSWQLGSHFLDFLSNKIDVFLVGRFFSMDELGLYNIAKELVLKPYSIINSISSSVLAAALAKIQKNVDLVRRYFLKIVSVVSVICIPIYVFMFIFADAIVSILYSSTFSEVAFFIRILFLVGIMSAITSQGIILQIALGRTDIGFRWTIVRTLLSSLVLVITCNYSVYAVAYGQMFLSVITMFLFYFLVVKAIIKQISLSEYCSSFYKIFFGVILWSLPFLYFMYCFEFTILTQIFLSILFMLGYILGVRLFNNVLYEEFINLIFRKEI